jgi:trimeric autotransporter adhesin
MVVVYTSLLRYATCVILIVVFWTSGHTIFAATHKTDSVSITDQGTNPVLSPCGIRLSVTPSACYSATNYYSLLVQAELINAPLSGTIAIRSAAFTTTYKAAYGAGTTNVPLSAFNLVSNGRPYSIEASLLGSDCGPISETFVAPDACTLPSPVALSHKVSRARAEVGEVVTFTVCVVNSGTTAATDLVVNQEVDENVMVIPGSLAVSTGSVVPNVVGALWTINSLPASSSATLTFSASVLTEGVQYCRATIPGAIALVCVSVPYKVCRGSDYAIQLDAPIGYDNYQWRITKPNETTATVVYNGPLSSFTASQPGLCELYLSGRPGSCGDVACCPVLIEETEVPVFSAIGRSPSCVNNQPQADGQVTLTNFSKYPGTVYEYQYSLGETYNANMAQPPVVITGDAIIGSRMREGKYTVRVTERNTGCFRDMTLVLAADCTCSDARCVPISVTRFTIEKKVK